MQVLFCGLLLLLHCRQIPASQARIRAHLLNNANKTYDRMTIPPGVILEEPDKLGAVRVDVEASLTQITEVDERNEVMTTALWLRYMWQDRRFQWSSAQFGDVKEVRMEQSEIWLPDLAVYNDVREEAMDTSQFPIRVQHTGQVRYAVPILLKASCKMNIRYFPFDIQICRLKIGSWTYDGKSIDVQNTSLSGDRTNYVANPEWVLHSFEIRRFSKDYGGIEYPDVSFFITIERRPQHYIINIIIPVIIIIMVSLFGFFLPPCEGERMGLVITNLLAMTVYLLMVADNLPAQSKVFPLIMEFFYFSLGTATIISIMNIVTLAAYYKGSTMGCKPSAKMINYFLNYLGPVWRITDRRDDFRERASLEMKEEETEINEAKESGFGAAAATAGENETSKNSCDCCLCNMGKYHVKIKPEAKCNCKFCNLHMWCDPKKKGESLAAINGKKQKQSGNGLENGTHQNHSQLGSDAALEEHNAKFHKDASRMDDLKVLEEATFYWNMIGIILDRYFFIITLILYLIGTIIIFLAPRVYDYDIMQKNNSY